MIVVSDTSPLNYLVLIDAIDLLPQLFGEVRVPPGVMKELQHPRTPELVKHWAAQPPEWLNIQAPSAATPLDPQLDPGEAEAIALALELGAAAILVDEKKGRRIAIGQGLTTLGTITVMELAASQGLLDLQSAFNSLQRTSFYLTEALINSALQRDALRNRAKQNEFLSSSSTEKND
jgi:predicted nucleic acid-binding protein